MDYSVGSLSDLITGSNTPNKVKVFKKEFKKEVLNTGEIQAGGESNTPNKVKAVKKEFKKKVVDTGEIQEGGETPRKKNKRDKTLKEKNKSIKKAKLNKNISEPEGLDGNSENKSQGTEVSVNKKGSKGKKRKLEKPTPETEDVGLDENEPAQKKEKLSENEINAERRIKKKNKELKPRPSPEELFRTIFVGNVPIETTKKQIKTHFKKFGEIESVRFRGIPVADPKTSKKVAAIKKEYNPNRSNVFCYVRFVNKESAKKAEVENGALFEEHHLRVHCCESQRTTPDEAKAIFVGNLSFDAEEDELWKLFESCGPISYVRIVRDSYTGMGKGFAYVNFKDSDAVQLALEMENVKIKDRELRIKLSNLNVAKKNKKQNKKKKPSRPRRGRKNIEGQSEGIQESGGQQVKVKEINGKFQGTKFSDKKKKQKVNKGLLQKKKLVKKIAPKPK